MSGLLAHDCNEPKQFASLKKFTNWDWLLPSDQRCFTPRLLRQMASSSRQCKRVYSTTEVLAFFKGDSDSDDMLSDESDGVSCGNDDFSVQANEGVTDPAISTTGHSELQEIDSSDTERGEASLLQHSGIIYVSPDTDTSQDDSADEKECGGEDDGKEDGGEDDSESVGGECNSENDGKDYGDDDGESAVGEHDGENDGEHDGENHGNENNSGEDDGGEDDCSEYYDGGDSDDDGSDDDGGEDNGDKDNGSEYDDGVDSDDDGGHNNGGEDAVEDDNEGSDDLGSSDSMCAATRQTRGQGTTQNPGRGRGQGSTSNQGRGREQGTTHGRGRGRGQATTRGQGRGRGRGQGTTRGRGGTRGQNRTGIPKCAKSISVTDTTFEEPEEFQPLRDPGPYLPATLELEPTALDIFCLFIDDEVLEHLVTATNQYAAQKRDRTPTTYERFMRHPLTAEEVMRFLGCLLLLSINSVRNYRQAWNSNSSQHLVQLSRLLSRDRFEHIASFLHLVTPSEEAHLSQHRLKKILPFHQHVKRRCLELYQPLQQLSVDERMVKSKARTHFRQYIRNKPTKWGYKYWVLADPTGYTVDFNVYYGADTSPRSGKGLGYDVVNTLVEPFRFQGYQVFCDNFYSSPALFTDLAADGIAATGTLRTNRQGIPADVLQLKNALNKSNVKRGTGYYIRQPRSKLVYTVWKDKKAVTVMSTAFPGHSTGTVKRRVKDGMGFSQLQSVPIPQPTVKYNAFMGGVDKSDQFISYNRILRRTVRYWKTMFYHLLEICATNSSIIYNWYRMASGKKRLSETRFRDSLVCQIISKFGKPAVLIESFTISHGSCLFDNYSHCVLCHTNVTARRCPDCPLQPALCQVRGRDCHSLWHSTSNLRVRNTWYKKRRRISKGLSTQTQKSGRPKGSTNLKKRRGFQPCNSQM